MSLEKVTVTPGDVGVLTLAPPPIEQLIARRARLLQRIGKYEAALARAAALHAECRAELDGVTAGLEAALARAQDSLARTAPSPSPSPSPAAGGVTINVPAARLGVASEG